MFELPKVPEDTSKDTKNKIIELLRAMPPEKKLNRIFDLSAFAKSLIISEMQQSKCYESDREFKSELALRIYGSDVGSRIADLYK